METAQSESGREQVLTPFACCKCKSPIEIDMDIVGLNAAGIHELTTSTTSSSTSTPSPSKKTNNNNNVKISIPVATTSPGASGPGAGAGKGISRVTVHPAGKMQTENSPAGFFSSVSTDASFIVLPPQSATALSVEPSPAAMYAAMSHLSTSTAADISGSMNDDTLTYQQQTYSEGNQHKNMTEDILFRIKQKTIDSIDDQNIVIKTRQLARIFELLSSKSTIDFPICKDCSDSSLQLLEEELRRLMKDRAVYEEMLEQAKSVDRDLVVEDEELEKVLNSLSYSVTLTIVYTDYICASQYLIMRIVGTVVDGN
jgi:hypothetical protein